MVDPAPLEGGVQAVLSRLPPVPEARCSTLTPASVRALHQAGAWPAVEASGRATAFDAMQVWDAQGGGGVRYTAAEAGRSLLGHVVENSVLTAALAARLREDATPAGRLTLYAPDTLCELAFRSPDHDAGGAAAAPDDAGPDWAAARLQQAGWVRARLVVAADGARSATRTLAGARLPRV